MASDDLPNLSKLSLQPRRGLLDKQPRSAIYCLDSLDDVSKCESSVLLARNFLPLLKGEYDEARSFMETNVKIEYTMGTTVPRLQATFGPIKYKNYQLFSDETRWPALVKRVREETVAFARKLSIPNPEEYSGVHVNYYKDEASSVMKHADDEPQLIEGAPIFSYTYMGDPDPALARGFTVWKKSKGAEHIDGRGKMAEITLFSGDLLVMQGQMQKYFEHSIEKVKDGRRVAPRLNFTVRKFTEAKSSTQKRQVRAGDEPKEATETEQEASKRVRKGDQPMPPVE